MVVLAEQLDILRFERRAAIPDLDDVVADHPMNRPAPRAPWPALALDPGHETAPLARVVERLGLSGGVGLWRIADVPPDARWRAAGDGGAPSGASRAVTRAQPRPQIGGREPSSITPARPEVSFPSTSVAKKITVSPTASLRSGAGPKAMIGVPSGTETVSCSPL